LHQKQTTAFDEKLLEDLQGFDFWQESPGYARPFPFSLGKPFCSFQQRNDFWGVRLASDKAKNSKLAKIMLESNWSGDF
jgi:hypothetical protein